MPNLSIIIVSWNTSRLLAACLRSIEEQLGEFDIATIETIVIDNASVDESPVMVRQDFPWVRLVANAENIGFAAANNQALRQSSGDFVLLLNPDTVLQAGALAALLDFMEKQPQAGAAGSYLLNPDGTMQESCSRVPTLARELWRLLHLDTFYPLAKYPMQRWSADAARPVDVVQGASMIVRRSALDQVGYLDTDYFMYSEEVDLCHRIRSAGWEIYWVPQSRVVHYGGQSTQQTARAMFLQLYQSKVLYFRKRRGRLAAKAYKAVLFATAVARLSLTPFIGLQRANQRTRHAMLAGHYLQLVLHLRKM